jgi:hypothetical protein
MKSEVDFWGRIEKSAKCWNWQGPVDSRGYGHVSWDGKNTRAHRLAYTLTCGPIPTGEGHHGTVVMHSCDNKLCCNPAHLSLGTHADNMADLKAKGRRKNIGTGEENGRAVLSIGDVERIRNDVRGTRTIAKEYPVSRSAIQRIKTGKAWASA